VANDVDNTISVINGTTDKVQNIVHVGKHPIAITLDTHSNKVYVANYLDNTIFVINGTTDKVQNIVHVGKHPIAITLDMLDTHSNKVYVANYLDNTTSVINGATDKKEVPDISVGAHPGTTWFNYVTGMMYVLNYNTVSVIDGSRVAAGITFEVSPGNSGNIYQLTLIR
jgi:YVTN family beta-propeller protein